MKDLNKIKGSLVGGAVGDALGYAVEFMNENGIFSQYGKKGITRYADGFGRISDDTQMTLFTAAGLMKGTDYVRQIARAYLDWYGTQTAAYPLADPFTGLASNPALFSRRAPGNTCLSALEHYALLSSYGSRERPLNDSKGCGGVMRVAPVGLYFAGSGIPIRDSDLLGADAAAITHGHEMGYQPAMMLSHIVRRLAEDENMTVREAVEEALVYRLDLFGNTKAGLKFMFLLMKAAELAEKPKISDLDAIHKLGEGWTGDEALAIAVFCALRHCDDFEAAIVAAVNHGGDSDSTGAICGNILGAKLGYDAIPDYFKGENLELHDVITDMAEKLYAAGKELPRGTAFAAPAIGIAVPDEVTRKLDENGLIHYYYPDGREWKP